MVRYAEPADLNDILSIYESARQFMRDHSNPDQWGTTHPAREILVDDINARRLFVVCSDNDSRTLTGCFALIYGDDPTYAYIEDGSWMSDHPYATIHRIASGGVEKGVFCKAVEYARETYSHLRIDTHKDNIPMQNAIKKMGFEYRGVIYVEDGSPRLAYEWVKDN